MQRRLDHCFPSFTLMSQELQKDTLRLPSYRESVFFRFHPYPQARRRTVDPLMRKVDYRSVAEPVASACEESRVPEQEEQEKQENESEGAALYLDVVMNRVEEPHVKKRRSLTSLIIDLALAVTAARLGKSRRSAAKLGADH
ncbi:hypothetical protein BD309DRAFT_944692 [Dichomitus squalens]|uniref:uncharacterized protein n=1 Tax=Dichomitus squalens (strain LYAD-421) TaxID=732165 RepID=UPI00044147A4|nr:uncharacterized protein DICSQDRAFT_151915 [Dichomitus squalens LYAD-421 SS1]EJF65869.1 hypothetical protein DICSQDRAFT_151915 [Dichomitus squalens LYAD-421 SS1]TBU50796.1 hypothetical protein BD309DRAFT_944692 [Dichomitus squalens]